ncbi:MAG TPA: glycosyltransferase family 39 protein [Candidatus Limnocylindria bacterium]|nr:glycosyltransferase family 39 protein [Candidatus Limnocylindria bacterium]
MRVGVVAAALLVLLSVVVLIPNHPAGRDPAEDSGVFFYAAQRLLDGGAPYRDIWDHKPPGVYFIDALGLAIGREAGVWLVQVAFLVAAALVGYRALRRDFGATAGLVGSLAWLAALPRLFLELGQTSFVEFYALPLQFGALLLLSEIRTLSMRRVIALGVLGGSAVLLKPTLVGLWLAIGVVVLLQRRRSALTPIVAMAIGALLPLALVAGWAAARGVLGDMVDQALAYNRAYAAFAPASDRIGAVLSGLRLTLPSGLALVAGVAWLYAVVTRRASPTLLAVALIAFPLEIALSTWGRGYHYYFIAWLPAMAILAAFAVSEFERRLPRRAVVPALALGVLAMFVFPSLLVTRLALRTDEGRFRAAAAYVAANSRPSDTVLVWGSHTEVLFLADRRSPTRYVYQYAALSTRGYATPVRVGDFLSDLQRARPALILDASADSFVTPPLDLAGLRAWNSPEPQYALLPEMESVVSFIESAYERAGTEPATGWPVWRLRTP